MKIVPLENETVEYICKRYDKNFIFHLKIFNLIEGSRFKQIAYDSRDKEGEELWELMSKVIEMGIDFGKTKLEDDELKLPWFVYQDLVDQITLINTVCVENIKK
jgi:hypothetical protein